MSKTRYVALATLLVLVVFNHAQATTVFYTDFDQLIDRSDHVVKGTVQRIKSKRDKQTGEIFTIVKLKNVSIIDENGERFADKVVKIRYKGGIVDVIENGEKIGEEGVSAQGTPDFTKGEEVVVFIRNNGTASMPITGWEQGVFRISSDGSVADHNHLPVIGLEGAHVVLKTNNGIKSRKPLVNRTRTSSLSVEQPELLYSDGGEDVLVSTRLSGVSTQAVMSEEQTDLMEKTPTMDVSNFVSMIQERKGVKSLQVASRAGNISTDDLFNLPKFSIKMKDGKGNNSNKAIAMQQQDIMPDPAPIMDDGKGFTPSARPTKKTSTEK